MVKKLLLIILGVLLISLVSAWGIDITKLNGDSIETYYGANVTNLHYQLSDINCSQVQDVLFSSDGGVTNISKGGCSETGGEILLPNLMSNQDDNDWMIIVENMSGDIKSDSVSFWVDSIPPNITLINPDSLVSYTNTNSLNLILNLLESNKGDYYGDSSLVVLRTFYYPLGGLDENAFSIDGNNDSDCSLSLLPAYQRQGEYNWIAFTKDIYPDDTIIREVNISGVIIRDTIAPYYSNEENQSDNVYAPGKDYTFNITWEDSLSGIDAVAFILNSQSYVVTNVGDVYSVIVSDLAAGNYNYIWNAVDKAGNTNTIGILTYTVDKAETTLNLDSSPSWDEDYLTETTVNGNCPLQLTCNLYKDNIWVSEPDTQTLGAGSYVYVYNTSGNQNYTSATNTSTLIINKISPEFRMSINGTSPIIYGTASDFEGIETNTGDVGCIYEFFIDGTLVSNPDNLTYAAGTYTYVYNTSGCSNYLAGGVSRDLVINKLPQTAILDINETSPITYGTEIVVNCNGILYREGINISDEIGINILLGAGEYNYSCVIEESQNYSGDIDSKLFVVNKATSTVELYINGSRNNLTIENSGNISINATLVFGEGDIEIYREGNLIAPGYHIFDSPGTYNITAIYEESENYSSSYETFFVYIHVPPPYSPSGRSRGSCKTIWNCTLWGEWGECINDTQNRICLEKERVRCGKGIKLKELEKGETRSFCVINTTESIEEPEIIKEPEENPVETEEEKGFFSRITGSTIGFVKSGTGILTFAVIGVLLVSWTVLHFRRKGFR